MISRQTCDELRGSDVSVGIRAIYDKPAANFVHAGFPLSLLFFPHIFFFFYRTKAQIEGFEFLIFIIRQDLIFTWPSVRL